MFTVAMTDKHSDKHSDKNLHHPTYPTTVPRGGNRVFTKEESTAIWGPHPHAHLGDEIRARIKYGKKANWWKAPPD